MNRTLYSELNFETLRPDVYEALRHWADVSGSEKDLLSGLLIVRNARRKVGISIAPVGLRKITNDVLLKCLDRLKKRDSVAAKVVIARFAEGVAVNKLALAQQVSGETINRIQRRGITKLTQLLLEDEQQARHVYLDEVHETIPLARNVQLFGIESLASRVTQQLTKDGFPWLVSLAGIGGIGKSALAGKITLNVMSAFQFDQVVWLTIETRLSNQVDLTPELLFSRLLLQLAAKLDVELAQRTLQDDLAQIRRQLRSRSCIIIIDNIEDPTDYAFLLPHIESLCNPSCFLLTTRAQNVGETSVKQYVVRELDQANAQKLIEHQAVQIGLAEQIPVTDDLCELVYGVVGGNPLAIKIVLGLALIMPISNLLARLREGNVQPVAGLYSRLFEWSLATVSQEARTILLTMILSEEQGVSAELLQEMCDLEEENFWRGTLELTSRSLLDVNQRANQQTTFHVHSVTASFLSRAVLGHASV